MRYVRVNDRDYVKVENNATVARIIEAWLHQKHGKPYTMHTSREWRLLRLNANGTSSGLLLHEIPVNYADFDIIESGDNA